jgi:hypothetical protein
MLPLFLQGTESQALQEMRLLHRDDVPLIFVVHVLRRSVSEFLTGSSAGRHLLVDAIELPAEGFLELT